MRNNPPAVPPKQGNLVHVSKIAVPVTVVLGVIWILSQVVFGAGGKVSGSEKDIAYLTSKCDALAASLAETKTAMKEDHDLLIEQRVKLGGLKEYVDNEMAGKNMTISIADDKKK